MSVVTNLFPIGAPAYRLSDLSECIGTIAGYAPYGDIVVKRTNPETGGITHEVINHTQLLQPVVPHGLISIKLDEGVDRQDALIEARWVLWGFFDTIRKSYRDGAPRRRECARLVLKMIDSLNLDADEEESLFSALRNELNTNV